MDSVKHLRQIFRTQLVARGLLSAGLTLLSIFVLGLITFDLSAWWFQAVPFLASVASWIRDQDPWNFFFYVFIIVNLLSYGKQIQGVFLDRHNARILIQLSEKELQESNDPAAESGKRRAELNGRRRLLESLFLFDPLLWGAGSLALAFVILGHYLAALCLVVETIAVVLWIPKMVKQFSVLRTPAEEEDEAELDKPKTGMSKQELRAWRQANKDPELQAQRSRDRAKQNLENAAERMMTLINRPIVRIKIGWPVITLAAAAVGLITVSLIVEMSSGGDLPGRATLLILLLVLASNTALRIAQHSEDLAFFTSALEQIISSEDGSETL